MPISGNLIDKVSLDPKPKEPLSDLWVLKQEFSGMNSHDKVQYVRQKMKENNCDCYVITALDEIAWLLNSISPSTWGLIVVRGNDMPCNPLFYSFLVLIPQEAFLFVEESRLNWPVLPSPNEIDSRLLLIRQHMPLSGTDSLTPLSIISLFRMPPHLSGGGLIQEVQ